MYLGGLEAGDTNFVCAVGDADGNVLVRERIPTADPQTTMAQVIRFFENFKIVSIGVGTFGSIDLNKESVTYGSITASPKRGWAHYPLFKNLSEAVGVPIGITTNMNAAALGELHKGAAQGLDGCLYMTVGTGISAGLITENRFLHGLTHPEMGHILLRHHPKDVFQGLCPQHRDCLEGLASGPAIEARWGKKITSLGDDHMAWSVEATYLAQALMHYALIVSPKRIILGGAVMKQNQLFPLIRARLQQLLAGSIDRAELKDQIDSYVVPPALGENAGITGALILGRETLQQRSGKIA